MAKKVKMAATPATWTPEDASGLKAGRKALGYSQQEFADFAGVSRRRFSWIEYTTKAGTVLVSPTADEREGIAKALTSAPKPAKVAKAKASKEAKVTVPAARFHSHDGRKSHPATTAHR